MSLFLGVDTSNYTTSVAVYDSEKNKIVHARKLLPVKDGALGLKQSDAVFNHVKQLGEVCAECMQSVDSVPIAVGVSTRPREQEGSYMPCFLVGQCAAQFLSSVLKIPTYPFAHQSGHVAAAIYSTGAKELYNKEHLAFHFSGGTTECVHITPDSDCIFSAEIIAASLDLKAGQAIDRVGKMLGLAFPAGKCLDELSHKSQKKFKIKPVFKGMNCCISGLENKCQKMQDEGLPKEDIAKYCITYIVEVAKEMLKKARSEFPNLPVVFSGGVMSNSMMREALAQNEGVYFGAPEFSSDNAAGIAVLTYIKHTH